MERNTGGVGKCMEADMIVTSTKRKEKKKKKKKLMVARARDGVSGFYDFFYFFGRNENLGFLLIF